MDTASEILKELSSLASTKLLIAVVTAILVVILGKLAIRLLNRTVKKLKIDPTLHKFLMAVCRVIIYFVAIMIVAGSLGFEMSSLVALASVVSAAFALAASGMLSNLFGGILLLLTKPFGVGDYIAVSGEEGRVLEIGILNTKINTMDNKRLHCVGHDRKLLPRRQATGRPHRYRGLCERHREGEVLPAQDGGGASAGGG